MGTLRSATEDDDRSTIRQRSGVAGLSRPGRSSNGSTSVQVPGSGWLTPTSSMWIVRVPVEYGSSSGGGETAPRPVVLTVRPVRSRRWSARCGRRASACRASRTCRVVEHGHEPGRPAAVGGVDPVVDVVAGQEASVAGQELARMGRIEPSPPLTTDRLRRHARVARLVGSARRGTCCTARSCAASRPRWTRRRANPPERLGPSPSGRIDVQHTESPRGRDVVDERVAVGHGRTQTHRRPVDHREQAPFPTEER